MTVFKKNGKIYLNYTHNNVRKKRTTDLEWNDTNLKIVKSKIIPELERALIIEDIGKVRSFSYYSNLFLKHQENKTSYLIKEPYWLKAINVFKDRNINEITALDIQLYVNSLNMKAKSKKEYLYAIRNTFKYAIMDGAIRYNPAIDIDCGKDRKTNIEYFEIHELNKIIQFAKADRSDDIYNYLILVANTGMRPEEAIALNWRDINNGYITINKAMTRGKLVPTKTSNGVRKIPFKFVKSLKSNMNLAIFPKQKDVSHFRHQWKRVLNMAEVTYRSIKNLRHTFATLSLKNGVPINILSSVLGHSSPKVTLQHYTSIIHDEKLDDDRLFSLVPETSPMAYKSHG